MKRLAILLMCWITSPLLGDSGHVVLSTSTDQLNVAVFVEPWPLRVGETHWSVISTDKDGTFIQDADLQVILHHTVALIGSALVIETPLAGVTSVELLYAGTCSIDVHVSDQFIEHTTLDVLPTPSVLFDLWQVWIFLFLGLLAIILREILARIHSRRYP